MEHEKAQVDLGADGTGRIDGTVVEDKKGMERLSFVDPTTPPLSG